MSQNLTHNENIKIFIDVVRHLKLEAKRLETIKPSSSLYTAQLGSRKAFRPKSKNLNSTPQQGADSG